MYTYVCKGDSLLTVVVDTYVFVQRRLLDKTLLGRKHQEALAVLRHRHVGVDDFSRLEVEQVDDSSSL